jgi:dolichyl-phosphate beta-glucosyltransferase
MAGAPHLTVVVPAFNEERRLLPTLQAMERWLDGRGTPYEVLVVDDGSADRTKALAGEFAGKHPAFRVVALPENRGKGAAVRAGFAESRGSLVLFSDADLSTPLEELDRLSAALGDGADVAIASRALPGSNLEIRQAWYREHMGKTFNALVRLFTGLPFHDTQCGFKLFRGEDARSLASEMREDGFSFDVELLLLAGRHGLAVREIPVTWRNDEGSRVNPVQHSLAMLASLPRIVGRTGRFRG